MTQPTDKQLHYEITMKTCPKCGQDFDWIFGVCPSCYPNGYIDAIREITGLKDDQSY